MKIKCKTDCAVADCASCEKVRRELDDLRTAAPGLDSKAVRAEISRLESNVAIMNERIKILRASLRKREEASSEDLGVGAFGC